MGKQLLHNSSWKRGVRLYERKTSADTKVSEEGGGGGARGAGAVIPLQPMVKTTMMQVVPLPPMEDHSGADICPAAPGAPRTVGRTHVGEVHEGLSPVGRGV